MKSYGKTPAGGCRILYSLKHWPESLLMTLAYETFIPHIASKTGLPTRLIQLADEHYCILVGATQTASVELEALPLSAGQQFKVCWSDEQQEVCTPGTTRVCWSDGEARACTQGFDSLNSLLDFLIQLRDDGYLK